MPEHADVDVTRPRPVDDVVDDLLTHFHTSAPVVTTLEVRVFCAELVQAARHEMAEELEAMCEELEAKFRSEN